MKILFDFVDESVRFSIEFVVRLIYRFLDFVLEDFAQESIHLFDNLVIVFVENLKKYFEKISMRKILPD